MSPCQSDTIYGKLEDPVTICSSIRLHFFGKLCKFREFRICWSRFETLKECSQGRSPDSKTISCPAITACMSCTGCPFNTESSTRAMAVLTFESRSSATAPTYLSRHIKARVSGHFARLPSHYWTSRSRGVY